MQQAKPGDRVKVHYTGRLTDGSEFDSSTGNEPLDFVIGSGDVIPGFDAAVTGMKVGERRTVTIAAEDAYGPTIAELVADVARADLPEGVELALGGQLEVTQEDGSSFLVMVTALDAERATLDANHPLAGKDLVFDLDLVAID
jgi:peptidylprolyl isomerase